MSLSPLSSTSHGAWLPRAWRSLRDIAEEVPRDSFFEARQQFSDENAGVEAFRAARQRLLQPNGWKDLGPSWGAARFQVVPAQPRECPQVKLGDLLKIDLPGYPRSTWVQVESVVDEPDRFQVLVRPTGAPGQAGVEHIFGEATTNTFSLQRDGAEVVAQVHGQKEVANFTGPWWKDLMSATFLWGGWMGGKDHQWKPFVENLLGGPKRVD